MPVIKVQSTVVGYLSATPQLWLEGQEIDFGYDGNETWQSTDLIDVKDSILNIQFHARGLSGTDWKLEIVELEPNQLNLYKNSGKIGPTGHSLFADAVKI
jgi:hypothetical protein